MPCQPKFWRKFGGGLSNHKGGKLKEPKSLNRDARESKMQLNFCFTKDKSREVQKNRYTLGIRIDWVQFVSIWDTTPIYCKILMTMVGTLEPQSVSKSDMSIVWNNHGMRSRVAMRTRTVVSNAKLRAMCSIRRIQYLLCFIFFLLNNSNCYFYFFILISWKDCVIKNELTIL